MTDALVEKDCSQSFWPHLPNSLRNPTLFAHAGMNRNIQYSNVNYVLDLFTGTCLNL